MSEVDMKVVEQKITEGKPLSAAELKEVMSMPPEGMSNQTIAPEDDIQDEDFHDDTPAKKEEVVKKVEEPKKKEEAPKKAEAKKEDDDDSDPMARINTELAKDEGKEDLKDLTNRERGIFWELRRERKRAQKAEQERDALRFDNAKRKAQEDATKKEIVEEEEDPFKDRDPEDKISIKDLQKALKAKKPTAKDTNTVKAVDNTPLINAALAAQDKLARTELGDDYEETIECINEIISNNPVYLKQLSEALYKGENVAKLTYTLIKGDPDYTKTLPIAQARLKAHGKGKKSEEKKEEVIDEDKTNKKALEAQEKLKTNTTKNKTSAHIDGSAEGSEKVGDYTIDQLMNMSDRDFAKVPKKDRDAFLKKFGS